MTLDRLDDGIDRYFGKGVASSGSSTRMVPGDARCRCRSSLTFFTGSGPATKRLWTQCRRRRCNLHAT